MVLSILLPLCVAVLGAFLHLLSAKGAQLGLVMFWVGLFWTVAVLTHTRLVL